MSELPTTLTIKGKAVEVWEELGYGWRITTPCDQHGESPACFLNHSGQWDASDELDEGNLWPDESAAVEAACLAADLPPIDGRQPVVLREQGAFVIASEGKNYYWHASRQWLNPYCCRSFHATALSAYLAIAAAATGEVELPDGPGAWEHIPTGERAVVRVACGDLCFAMIRTPTPDSANVFNGPVEALRAEFLGGWRKLTAQPAAAEASGRSLLAELRQRKNQNFDGEATLTNEELDALLSLAESHLALTQRLAGLEQRLRQEAESEIGIGDTFSAGRRDGLTDAADELAKIRETK